MTPTRSFYSELVDFMLHEKHAVVLQKPANKEVSNDQQACDLVIDITDGRTYDLIIDGSVDELYKFSIEISDNVFNENFPPWRIPLGKSPSGKNRQWQKDGF